MCEDAHEMWRGTAAFKEADGWWLDVSSVFQASLQPVDSREIFMEQTLFQLQSSLLLYTAADVSQTHGENNAGFGSSPK